MLTSSFSVRMYLPISACRLDDGSTRNAKVSSPQSYFLSRRYSSQNSSSDGNARRQRYLEAPIRLRILVRKGRFFSKNMPIRERNGFGMSFRNFTNLNV